MSGRRTWSNRVAWKMEIGSKNRLKMWIIHPQLARRRGRTRKKMPRRGMLSSISSLVRWSINEATRRSLVR
ncbi:hypothetical protein FH972_027157 [Carpinus fangiana]|uniref:Uncharacterized protein n=1 Tax=Carpinus fangiana TaxID=176857 RepID=A0A5N6L8L0_9ROSI|nr:hypothetical protein FH972_027157 [Carpinus fangiana]